MSKQYIIYILIDKNRYVVAIQLLEFRLSKNKCLFLVMFIHGMEIVQLFVINIVIFFLKMILDSQIHWAKVI
jgi:hypothetical protein